MSVTRTYDFDLHGIVGIRLIDATTRDVATVTRQLGPLQGDVAGEPDLTIRFVDRATARDITHVGMGDTGFNEDGFFVLRGRGGASGRAQLPFDRIGHGVEIVCERSLPAVPHLLALINLVALGKGVLPMHATAFTSNELGILVTGWSKSGKTETLLGCMADGASYVGDEWVYLTEDGQMLGLPEPIRVWAWHLDQRPELLHRRAWSDRARLSMWRSTAAALRAGSGTRFPGAAIARKGAPVIERQAYLQVPPTELFGADRVALRGRLDAVVLVLSDGTPGIRTSSAGATEVADRMRWSLQDERAPFLAHYRQFRYAFPDRHSPAVESASATEARLLSRLFDHRPAAKVTHPYPCDLTDLGRAVVAAAAAMPPRREPAEEVSVS